MAGMQYVILTFAKCNTFLGNVTITFYRNVLHFLQMLRKHLQNGATFPAITGELILIKMLYYLQLNECIQMKIGVNTVFIEIKSSFNDIW